MNSKLNKIKKYKGCFNFAIFSHKCIHCTTILLSNLLLISYNKFVYCWHSKNKNLYLIQDGFKGQRKTVILCCVKVKVDISEN